MTSRDTPELDIARLSAAFERSVRAACPEHLPLALRVLGRLEPNRWTLEWHLPWWLGHGFGLDPETAGELVLSNLLGLASIRLQDDLADGDVETGELTAASELSVALYDEALAPYRARFPATSPFWQHLGSCMAAWRAATLEAEAVGSSRLDSRRLAARGAPLKISAYAVCLLTGRLDAYPVLDGCLDHALTGLVLYDHVGDWRGDLAAGRWNAFVAAASDDPQEPALREGNRSRVLLAMLTRDVVATWFGRITMETTRAATLVETLGLEPLVAYLREHAAMTEEQGSVLQAHYWDVAERAGRLLSGAAGGVGSRGSRAAHAAAAATARS